MDWKLYDKDGTFIQEVNCQFDSLDFAVFNDGTQVLVDFEKKAAYITKKKTGVTND